MQSSPEARTSRDVSHHVWSSSRTRTPTRRERPCYPHRELEHVSAEKAQQYEELSQRVHQLEATILSLREQASGAQNSPREPPHLKFDGARSLFRGFLNQVHLVIQLHPNRYSTDAARVGFFGTLLCDTALSWFAPQLEKKSPLLEDFEAFVKEFQASFGLGQQ